MSARKPANTGLTPLPNKHNKPAKVFFARPEQSAGAFSCLRRGASPALISPAPAQWWRLRMFPVAKPKKEERR